MGFIGSVIRGLVLAGLIGAVSAVVGALAALYLCDAGTCAAVLPVSELILTPTPGLPGDISAAVVLGSLLCLGLALVLMPREPVVSLALIFAVLIAVLSFLVLLPRSASERPGQEPVIEEPGIDEPGDGNARLGDEDDDFPDPSVLFEDDAPPAEALGERLPATPQTQTPLCEPGAYYDGVSCVPCEETVLADMPARLGFDAVTTGAYWTYARSAAVDHGGRSMAVEDFARELAQTADYCDAEALLVFGSASADGARARNERRARQRAENLAEALRQVCGNGVDIYPLSLGQSEAAQDLDEDRQIGIVKISRLGDAPIDGALILEELGYAIADGAQAAPLLSRRDRFPEPWTGPTGEETALQVEERPQVTRTVPAAGAPDSCGVPIAGLDETPSLRQ